MRKYFAIAFIGLSFQLYVTPIMLGQSNPCGDRFTSSIFSEADITITQDVQYGLNTNINGTEKILKFDYYEPSEDVESLAKRPLIIWAHGGSFVNGDENSTGMQHINNHFAQKGYACASINYRLIDFTTDVIPNIANLDSLFLDELVKSVSDMRAAIRFFRKDAAGDNVYQIDPNQIFVGGISAGGILAIHTAYIDTEEGFDDYSGPSIHGAIDRNGGIEGNSGNAGFPTNVNGVISLSGGVGDTVLVQAGEEPLFSVHTPEDDVVPYARGFAQVGGFPVIQLDGSAVLHQRLENLGIQNELLVFSGGHVAYYGKEEEREETDNAITSFLGTLVDCPIEVTSVATTTVEALPAMRFYPNPASSMLTIELNVTNTPTTVSIFDAVGKQVKQVQLPGNTYLNLDVTGLTTGMYFVQVNTATKQYTNSFVVK